MQQSPRLTQDKIAIGPDWGPVFRLYNIWSLWYLIIGGDVRVRWAPIGKGGEPDFSIINQEGELLPAGTANFDHLDNSHGCFQFKLDNPANPATLSFKAQAKEA